MSRTADSTLRDPSLAPRGHLKIGWVAEHMPILNEIRRELEATKPLAGQRVAICLHLEAKTAYLAMVMAAGGAEVSISGSNPLSTQDDVAAALAENGVIVHSWHNATMDEMKMFYNRVLDLRPTLLIDDGGDLVELLHSTRSDLAAHVLGGAEETTTGILRLKALEAEGKLAFPMLAVNNAYMKHLFDNRYGTGQSTWDGIMRCTNLSVAGMRVVVAGYGWCGKGVARRAQGLGARVAVTEVDPIRACEAVMDGYEVMPMADAARWGDLFVTTTGCTGVVRTEHMQTMRDGAIVTNAGHFDTEIDVAGLAAIAAETRVVRTGVEEYRLADGRRIHVLCQGRLINLAGADGHPVEVMDMTFALQALGIVYVLEHHAAMGRRVVPVTDAIDRRVAELRLRSQGITIDRLTPEQERYLKSWQI